MYEDPRRLVEQRGTEFLVLPLLLRNLDRKQLKGRGSEGNGVDVVGVNEAYFFIFLLIENVFELQTNPMDRLEIQREVEGFILVIEVREASVPEIMV
jgi:hypothetical protein